MTFRDRSLPTTNKLHRRPNSLKKAGQISPTPLIPSLVRASPTNLIAPIPHNLCPTLTKVRNQGRSFRRLGHLDPAPGSALPPAEAQDLSRPSPSTVDDRQRPNTMPAWTLYRRITKGRWSESACRRMLIVAAIRLL